MSLLDDQIKELQIKKLKSELLQSVKLVIAAMSPDRFQEIFEEVVGEVKTFIDNQINAIESGISLKNNTIEIFTPDEVNTLKLLSAKASAQLNSVPQNKPEVPPKPVPPPQDKISFTLQHRPLGGKHVNVENAGKGIVVGLDSPFILVKLDSGQTIQVTSDKITLISK